eukprot:4509557-Pyramimonas_sp.AAC.1
MGPSRRAAALTTAVTFFARLGVHDPGTPGFIYMMEGSSQVSCAHGCGGFSCLGVHDPSTPG